MQSLVISRCPALPLSARKGLRAHATNGSDSTPDTDLYDVLGVARNANTNELKVQYRLLSKLYHPDLSRDGQGSIEMAIRLNEAYAVLSDPVARGEYDRGLHRGASASRSFVPHTEPVPASAVTGPLTEGDLLLSEALGAAASAASHAAWVHWVRQWANTVVFGSELPLPLPAQVDPLPDGARLAFVSTASGSIRAVGEMHFLVTPEEGHEALGQHHEGVDALLETEIPPGLQLQIVAVKCRDAPDTIPGQQRVLKAFTKSLRERVRAHSPGGGHAHHAGWEIGGPLALFRGMFGGMPILSMLGGTERGDEYDSYHLPLNADAAADPTPSGDGGEYIR